ncbi:MAG TPA: penicillin-binding transpeptidase domain-containing protein, partial [Oligoflexia bacterium]|nr:penicillin-binding transpeptidase domain-containing protein [Oligoflexia bacterium]
ERLTHDKNKPLQNRAIGNAYPPGSTSKVLWSVAGLAERKIAPHTVLNCPGYVVLNNRPYRCHKKAGHGAVDLERAFMVSCNAYYYQLGNMLGVGNMTKYLQIFGFGERTGIELPGEEAGTCPSESWKVERFHERWYPGDSVPISIGQGYLVVTPLQMASLMATVANGGTRHQPTIVKKAVNTQTGQLIEQPPRKTVVIDPKVIDPKIFEKVRAAAANVVGSRQGTGWRAKLEGVTIGGKTGTAQVVRLGSDAIKDHAWFVAFAPVETPMIALAVLVENVGHGGEFSAPIARQVLEVYFRNLGMLPETVPAPEHAAPELVEEDTESTGVEESEQ